MRSSLLALMATLLTAPACAEVMHIDNDELARLLERGVPVVDIRTEGEWKETGIVAGSRLMTFFDERGRADPAAWLARLRAVAGAEEPVVVICRTGNRTRAVADFLDKQVGYKTVYNVKQGIHGWLRAGRPVVPAAPVLARCATPGAC
jgi:rhodanese-related sulfurtransferase